jgi:hypothetical protein
MAWRYAYSMGCYMPQLLGWSSLSRRLRYDLFTHDITHLVLRITRTGTVHPLLIPLVSLITFLHVSFISSTVDGEYIVRLCM